MKHIKKYKLFEDLNFPGAFKKDGDLKLLESLEENYDIYDFFEELKDYSYTSKVFNKDRVKDLSNRFIGDGIFERVVKLVDSIFNSLEEVNIEDIEEGMLDIFDEYHDVDRRVMLCVFHSDLEDIKKFNATLGIGSKDWPNLDGSKPRIICNILRDMIYPTLFIGYPSIELRFQKEERMVKDKKYQCVNFNVDDYTMTANVGKGIPNGSKRHTQFTKYDVNRKRNYNVEKFFEMYKPGIYISLGDNNTGYKLNLKKLESELDVVLPMALHNIDYKEVIWDSSRGTRKFNDDTDIYGYTVKILLK